MNPRVRIFLLSITALFSFRLSSQIVISNNTDQGKRSSEEKPVWVWGIGWNVVDDNSNAFKKLFDFRSSWNIRPYPTQLTADRSGSYGLTYGAVFNYNQYRAGKMVHGKELTGSFMFFSLDVNVKYHFNTHLKIPYQYDLYFPVGFGYTLRFAPPHVHTGTFNVGLGGNYWIYPWLGIYANSLAKFGLKPPFFKTPANYLQHSAGLVFKFSEFKRKRNPFVKPRYPWVHRKKVGTERLKKKK